MQAIEWLSYTYLYIRMKRNPLQYGLSMNDVEDDPQLTVRRYAIGRLTCAMAQPFHRRRLPRSLFAPTDRRRSAARATQPGAH